MSIFSRVARSVKKRIVPAAVGFLTGGPAGAATALLGTLGRGGGGQPRIPTTQAALPMLPALGGIAARALPVALRSLPAIGRTAVGAGRALARKFPRSTRALAELGLIAVGGFIFDAAGNMVGRRPPARRINPMNAKAARRAIRRIKGVRKICTDIERMLPKQKRACAPAPFARKRK